MTLQCPNSALLYLLGFLGASASSLCTSKNLECLSSISQIATGKDQVPICTNGSDIWLDPAHQPNLIRASCSLMQLVPAYYQLSQTCKPMQARSKLLPAPI
ncbi:hypothetical protein C8R42DRAFT_671749 [Lentinula raphanica]|nr:hypothetical protein C8R42DRAFT_671749 [Lentinula raphanica]